jgi:glycosyltransferase involved in cell wall biosynthesis
MVTRRFPPAPGGLENQIKEICSRLETRGHEVSVYTTDLYSDTPLRRVQSTVKHSPNGSDIKRFTALPIPCRETRGTTIAPRMLVALMRGGVPPIVHAHGLNLVTVSASLAAICRKAKIIFTTHHDPTHVGKRFATHFLDKCNGIVALTEIEHRSMLHLGLDRSKVRLIPNGIDLTRYSDLPRKDTFKKKVGVTNKLILYAGRIDVGKGCGVLVEAVAMAKKYLGDCTLAFVGPDWGSQEYLQSLAASRNIAALFLGNLARDELKEAFVSCDVFVLPSLEESAPLSIMEAMACGAPIVATCVGGVPAMVRHGETGLLVQPGDPCQLARAICSIIQDAALSRNMVTEARKWVSQYSIDNTVAQLEDFYRWTLAR